MAGDGEEEVVALIEAARRLGVRPEELRRRLTAAQVVRVGVFEVERRTTRDVALRRIERGGDDVPRWRRVADERGAR